MRNVTDPVCGRTIDADTAPAHAEHAGHTYAFDSEHCATEFRRHPDRYASAEGAGSIEQAQENMPPRTTKDGVTSPMFGSAGSGGAEFERIPEQDED